MHNLARPVILQDKILVMRQAPEEKPQGRRSDESERRTLSYHRATCRDSVARGATANSAGGPEAFLVAVTQEILDDLADSLILGDRILVMQQALVDCRHCSIGCSINAEESRYVSNFFG